MHGAAAIGGGGGEFADTSNITIAGGEITVSGGSYGAGIGGGAYGAGTNIRIEGNADVTAFGSSGAAIGAGYQSTRDSDITITDHATVDAASYNGCGIGQGLNASGNATITISGNASVNAEAFGSAAAIGSHRSSATVNIEDHADVTAVGFGVAIGTNSGRDSDEYQEGTSTVINITGGTVNAVTRNDFKPAIGTDDGNLDLTINSSTGKTTVNACTTSNDPLSLSIGTSHYDYSSWKHSTSHLRAQNTTRMALPIWAKTIPLSSIPTATLLWALKLIKRPKHLMIMHFIPLMNIRHSLQCEAHPL